MYYDDRDNYTLQQSQRGRAQGLQSAVLTQQQYADDDDQLEDMEELQEHLEAYIEVEKQMQLEETKKNAFHDEK